MIYIRYKITPKNVVLLHSINQYHSKEHNLPKEALQFLSFLSNPTNNYTLSDYGPHTDSIQDILDIDDESVPMSLNNDLLQYDYVHKRDHSYLDSKNLMIDLIDGFETTYWLFILAMIVYIVKHSISNDPDDIFELINKKYHNSVVDRNHVRKCFGRLKFYRII